MYKNEKKYYFNISGTDLRFWKLNGQHIIDFNNFGVPSLNI